MRRYLKALRWSEYITLGQSPMAANFHWPAPDCCANVNVSVPRSGISHQAGNVGFISWWPSTERSVWPDRVVFLPPTFRQYFGFQNRVKNLSVEKFVPEFSVKWFDVSPISSLLPETRFLCLLSFPRKEILLNESCTFVSKVENRMLEQKTFCKGVSSVRVVILVQTQLLNSHAQKS